MNERTFDQAMTRLEEVVALLEKGSEPLENSLKLFEEGTRLAAFCQKSLKDAEQKITQLADLEQKQEELKNE